MKKAVAAAVVLMACAVWLLTGCQTEAARHKEQAEREYPASLNSLMRGYADAIIGIARLPKPSPSLPRAAKDAVLADRMTDVAKTDALLAERLNALTPPPGQERIRATLADMFASTSQGYSRWSIAIRSGEIKAADRESDSIDRTQRQAAATLKALGVRFPAWSQGL